MIRTKFEAFCLGAMLSASMATLLVIQERCETRRLRRDIELLQTQSGLPSGLVVENARLPGLIQQTSGPMASSSEPTHELMRLRGEVGQLRRESESLRQQKDEVSEQLRRRELESLDPIYEGYRLSGIDTNSVPNVTMGATANDVLAELQRVRANLLEAQEGYVHAEVFPTAVAGIDSRLPAIGVQFFFESGRLVSRKDWPR
jgi:hypothetical protein